MKKLDMKRAAASAAVWMLLCGGSVCSADVLLARPQSPTGGLITSCWVPPDGTDADVYAWDTFVLPSAATVSEIQWQGDGYGSGAGFTITINPTMTLPDQPGVLARYHVPGNAGMTPAGIINGTQRYTYHYTLPTALSLSGGLGYAINIEGINGWSASYGTGGNGSHIDFYVGLAMFLRGGGNPAFTLLGTSACTGAAITAQPAPTRGCGGGGATAHFTVAASGTGPLTYHWRKGTTPINTLANPSAATATLTLTALSAADAASYDCIVTNGCGSATSNAAALTVCIADVNCDSVVDFFDYLDFVAAFSAAAAQADFNNDGVIDFFDYLDFVDAFSTGC